MERKISGHLMSRDKEVAIIRESVITPIHWELLPLYFQQDSAQLSEWLKMRSIDTGRTNSRLLRKSLGLSDANTEDLVMSVNAAMITDNYWIKPQGSFLTWEDIRFEQNNYANMSLLGSFSEFNQPGSRTPELTSPGTFEKCWKMEDGKWWLYKLSDLENLYSELIAYKLCELFGYKTAYYEEAPIGEHGFVGKLKPGRGVIRTLDFTNGASVNFEPAAALGLKSDDISYNYQVLATLSQQLADEYFDIITMDTLIYNLDRHTQNFGVLRNVESGEIISLAPNFDNNLALLAGIHGMSQRSSEKDRLFQEWKRLVQGNLLDISLPALDENRLREIIDSTSVPIEDKDKQIAFAFILESYSMVDEVALQMNRYHRPEGPTLKFE